MDNINDPRKNITTIFLSDIFCIFSKTSVKKELKYLRKINKLYEKLINVRYE